MDAYEESSIGPEHLRVSVFRRPGMYFGDMEDGTAYAVIVAELVESVLSWKTGANLSVTLRADQVEVACHARLPGGEPLPSHVSRRPFTVCCTGQGHLGFSWFTAPLRAQAFACREAHWEIRDEFGEQSAVFDEGVCVQAGFSAPDLPEALCFRVSLGIGTERLPITPAKLDPICQRIRHMAGPMDAGYWGCVTLRDERVGETRVVVVTSAPPHPAWTSQPE